MRHQGLWVAVGVLSGVLLVQVTAAALPAKHERLERSESPGLKRHRNKAVPEMPVSGVGAALTLILGGTAIALDRRRRSQK